MATIELPLGVSGERSIETTPEDDDGADEDEDEDEDEDDDEDDDDDDDDEDDEDEDLFFVSSTASYVASGYILTSTTLSST